MLRDGMTGDWLGTFMGHKGAVWSGKLSEDGSRAVTGSADFTASVCLPSFCSVPNLRGVSIFSKVWDTFTGQSILTLSHNHIVRSVDISSKATHLVSGGQEKKLRLFDIQHPDTPSFFTTPELKDQGLAHSENIKSVIYDEANQQIVSADQRTLK